MNTVSKSSFLIPNKWSKNNLAIFFIITMFSGLLFSRLLLSVGMIGLGATGLWNHHPKEWIKNKWWLLGLSWILMYAISGFWSDDKHSWEIFLQLKLPIVLLPLAFNYLPDFNTRQKEFLLLSVGLLLTGGTLYSLSFLVRDFDYYVQGYNISHLIPVPVYGNYICFSMTIVLYIIWVTYSMPSLSHKSIKNILVGINIFLVIYIHILASKSGLLSLYIFFISWVLYRIVKYKSFKSILLLPAILGVLYLATEYIPTLYQRREHIIFTLHRLRDGDRSGKLGDQSRLMAYHIAYKLIPQHPWIGYGTGDVLNEMKKGYDLLYPEVPNENRLIPHNQFLTVAMGCGIPTMLLFAVWFFAPLRRLKRNRISFYFLVTWFIIFTEFFIEPFLEGQFGVFVCIYFILLMKRELDRTLPTTS